MFFIGNRLVLSNHQNFGTLNFGILVLRTMMTTAFAPEVEVMLIICRKMAVNAFQSTNAGKLYKIARTV